MGKREALHVQDVFDHSTKLPRVIIHVELCVLRDFFFETVMAHGQTQLGGGGHAVGNVGETLDLGGRHSISRTFPGNASSQFPHK